MLLRWGTHSYKFEYGQPSVQIYEDKYVVHSISFKTFIVQAFKIVVDSWKFAMLLLYILWDDWPIFTPSGSKEQLQQQLEYTLLIVTAGEFQNCNLEVRTL